MAFSQFIVTHIDTTETLCTPSVQDFLDLCLQILDLERDIDVSFNRIRVAIRKLGNSTGVHLAHHLHKTAWFLGNDNCTESFRLFTQFGSFGNKSQTVKVDIGTRDNGYMDIIFSLWMKVEIFLDSSQCKGTCRLTHRSSIYSSKVDKKLILCTMLIVRFTFKYILDSSTHFVIIHKHNIVDQASN